MALVAMRDSQGVVDVSGTAALEGSNLISIPGKISIGKEKRAILSKSRTKMKSYQASGRESWVEKPQAVEPRTMMEKTSTRSLSSVPRWQAIVSLLTGASLVLQKDS